MKDIIGTHMKYKGFIVPRREYFSRLRQADITQRAKVRLSWMDYYQKVKNARLTCRHFGISPDTFYRWKKRYKPYCLKTLEDNPKSRRPHKLRIPTTPFLIVERIKSLREIYPRWGKEKLRILLAREGYFVSSSTIGRTIKRLKDRGVLKEPIPNFISSKKKYLKRAWEIRKTEGFQAKEPGDLIQLDTLDIRSVPGVVRKQFTLKDTISKWDVFEVYGNATAKLAAKFLDSLIKRTPYPIYAIQIDGGSEFKAEFEEEYQKRSIRLFILPPRRPDLKAIWKELKEPIPKNFMKFMIFP